MKQEDKQLLLKDLLARLPYGVKLGFRDSNIVLEPREYNIFTKQLFTNQMNTESNITVGFGYEIHNYLPYLRPMSSMTEEEDEELKHEIELELQALASGGGHNTVNAAPAAFEIDFYNKHHFDYRGLIPMGLALKAPDGMYKY